MTKIDLVVTHVAISPQTNGVRIGYAVKLQTSNFDGLIAGGESETASEAVQKAVQDLLDIIHTDLMTTTGLEIEATVLGRRDDTEEDSL